MAEMTAWCPLSIFVSPGMLCLPGSRAANAINAILLPAQPAPCWAANWKFLTKTPSLLLSFSTSLLLSFSPSLLLSFSAQSNLSSHRSGWDW